MSLGLDELRGLMVDHLRGYGIAAVTAWSGAGRKFGDEPLVSVSLRRCSAGQSGFANYLGEKYNEDTGNWQEIYARKVDVTLGLDIYCPVELGEEAVDAAFDQLVVALTEGAPSGLNLEEISCGETGYSEEGVLKRSVQAVCALYLYAMAEAGELFLDFKVKGGFINE